MSLCVCAVHVSRRVPVNVSHLTRLSARQHRRQCGRSWPQTYFSAASGGPGRHGGRSRGEACGGGWGGGGDERGMYPIGVSYIKVFMS